MRRLTTDNRVYFYILFFGIIYLTFTLIKPLLTILGLSLMLAIIFQPVYKLFKKIFRKTAIATPFTLLTILIAFITPILFLTYVSVNQLSIFIKDIGDFAGVDTGLEEAIGNQEESSFRDGNDEDRSQIKLDQDADTNMYEDLDTNSQGELSINMLTQMTDSLNEILLKVDSESRYTFAVEDKSSVQRSTSIGNLDVQGVIEDLNEVLEDVPFVELELTLEQVQDATGRIAVLAGGFVATQILDFLTGAPVFFLNLILFIILLAILLPSVKSLKKFYIKLSPLDDHIDNLYLKKIGAMAVSMVRGTFIISIIQGLTIGFLLWIAGIDYIVFWTVLAIFLSIIPNGGAIISWPMVIFLAISGNVFGTVVVFLGNLLIVANIDSFLRPWLTSKDAQLHPALTLIGVIGGLQTFGFLGVIFGPVIMIFLITTFDVYTEYYKNYEVEQK